MTAQTTNAMKLFGYDSPPDATLIRWQTQLAEEVEALLNLGHSVDDVAMKMAATGYDLEESLTMCNIVAGAND